VSKTDILNMEAMVLKSEPNFLVVNILYVSDVHLKALSVFKTIKSASIFQDIQDANKIRV
jgi:hypothetical protein